MHPFQLFKSVFIGWRLHFILDASLTSLPVKVFVNHPLDPKEGPNRDKYREVPWTNESPLRSDNYDSFAEVPIVLAGSFNYFFTVDGRWCDLFSENLL